MSHDKINKTPNFEFSTPNMDLYVGKTRIKNESKQYVKLIGILTKLSDNLENMDYRIKKIYTTENDVICEVWKPGNVSKQVRVRRDTFFTSTEKKPDKIAGEIIKKIKKNNFETAQKVDRNAIEVFTKISEKFKDLEGRTHHYKGSKKIGEGGYSIAKKVMDIDESEERILLVSTDTIKNTDRENIEARENIPTRSIDQLRRLKHLINNLNQKGINYIPKYYAFGIIGKQEGGGFVQGILMEKMADYNELNKDKKIEFCEKLNTNINDLHEKGFCHGDLKPDNVKGRNNSGGTIDPVLIDLDTDTMINTEDIQKLNSKEQLVKYIKADTKSSSNYCPPYFGNLRENLIEQIEDPSNTRSLDSFKEEFVKLQQKKDQFGLACIVFEAVTGEQIPAKFSRFFGPQIDYEQLEDKISSLSNIPEALVDSMRKGFGTEDELNKIKTNLGINQ